MSNVAVCLFFVALNINLSSVKDFQDARNCRNLNSSNKFPQAILGKVI